MGAFALLGKHCQTGLALILARYNKDPGQKQQALREVIATGRTLAPAYLAKLTRRADGKAITSVALLALDAYCRTADTPAPPVSAVRGEASRWHGPPTVNANVSGAMVLACAPSRGQE